MKRYYLNQYGEMVEDKTGEFNDNKHVKQWVKAEIAEEMVKLLKEIEWLEVWDDYVDGPIFNCPVCGSLDIKGHHESCELGKLLVKVGGEGE